jgi:hypothetical protein
MSEVKQFSERISATSITVWEILSYLVLVIAMRSLESLSSTVICSYRQER